MLLADVLPADVIGDSLRLHLGPTEWPAVATRTITVGAFLVRLEVLAASHRVQVLTLDHRPVVTETVACGSATAPPVDEHRLPTAHHEQLGGATYRFGSTSETGREAVHHAAQTVRRVERGLQVAFPGHPDALTGICLHPAHPLIRRSQTSLGWTTFHVYPGATPHVVTTSSTLTLPRRPS